MESMDKMLKFFNMKNPEDISNDMKVSFLIFARDFENFKEMVKAGGIPEEKVNECVKNLITNKEYLMMLIVGYQLAVGAGEDEKFEQAINEFRQTAVFEAFEKASN